MAMIPLDQIVYWLAWILLHFVWQGAVIGGLLWITLRAIDLRASRMRYGLACGALLAMAVSPLATGWMLSGEIRPVPPLTNSIATSELRSNVEASFAFDHTAGIDAVDVVSRPPRTPLANNSGWTEFALKTIHRWSGVFVVLWLSGVACFGSRLLLSLYAVRELRRSGIAVTDSQLLNTIASLTERFRVRTSVRLMQSASVRVPLVLGWLRPIILIPVSLSSGLTIDQIQAVLAHELAHIKRHDYLVNLLQSLVETLLFYHPAVWWVSQTIRDEREHCCDAIALQAVSDRKVYAKALFELARQATQPVSLTVAVDGGSLTHRIRRILGLPATNSVVAGPVIVVLAGLLLMFLATACSLFQFGNATAEDQAKSPEAANDATTKKKQPSNDEAVIPVPEDYHKVTFVIAKHLQFHQGQIVTWDEIEKILDDACAIHGKIQPAFIETKGGVLRSEKMTIHRIYKRLYDSKKVDGMISGNASPRASARYDRIETAADLVSDQSARRTGKVVDSEDKPLRNAEIILLPKEWLSVYLRDGQLRGPHEEHVVSSDDFGRFETNVEPGEELIAAIHPHGFAITTLADFESTKHLQLQPWARVQGRIHMDDTSKQTVSFTAQPLSEISFNLYETQIDKDGVFDQKFIPPGSVTVQRHIQTDGMGYSFPVSSQSLKPGEQAEVDIGPVPDNQKKETLEEFERQRRAREQPAEPTSQATPQDNPPAVPIVDSRRRVTFVLAEHVQFHEGQIVTWDEIETILNEDFTAHGKVRPVFLSTQQSVVRQAELNSKRTEIYRRLHDSGRINGMVVRPTSSRASARYDRIHGPADLVSDRSSAQTGVAIDPAGNPVANAEVLLLGPSNPILPVQLLNGRLRDAHDEHLVQTGGQGQFSIRAEPEERFIAATHEIGFCIKTIEAFSQDRTLTLLPWGELYGTVSEHPDEKQSISFMSLPMNGVGFQIAENAIAEDRSFQQRFVPPGTITAHRIVNAGRGNPMSFVAKQLDLKPGDLENVSLGMIPRNQTFAYHKLHDELNQQRLSPKAKLPNDVESPKGGIRIDLIHQPSSVFRKTKIPLTPRRSGVFRQTNVPQYDREFEKALEEGSRK